MSLITGKAYNESHGNPGEAFASIEYLAGAIDSEGCIGINKYVQPNGKVQYSARISLAMIHPFVPTELHRRFGGSISVQKSPRGYSNLFRWTATGNRVAKRPLQTLLPFLRVKKEQALNALALIDAWEKKNGYGIKLSSEEMAVREALFQKAKVLNRPAPATTERDTPATGCDSLNLRETVRDRAEAPCPLAG